MTLRVFGAFIAIAGIILGGPADGRDRHATAATIIHVKAATPGGDDGNSWATAFDDLQDALDLAASGDQVWVAAGTYKPSVAPLEDIDPRAATFALKSGVEIYGGFAGTETALDQRDVAANATILSGDIADPGDATDNVYHVVIGHLVAATAALDGFTVRDGRADGATAPKKKGAGIYVRLGNPRLRNLTVMQNTSTSGGGGLLAELGSEVEVTDSRFIGNNVTSSNGGGVQVHGSTAVIERVAFSTNSANFGGGLQSTSSTLTLTDSTFETNVASNAGGGIFVAGGTADIRRVTLSGQNSPTANGAGISVAAGTVTIENATVTGGNANAFGAAWFSGGTVTISHTTIASNSGSDGSVTRSGTDGVDFEQHPLG